MSRRRTAKTPRKRPAVVARKPKPWGMIVAAGVVVALAGVVFGYAYVQIAAKNEREEAMSAWVPSEDNQDPSEKIADVVKVDYPGRNHVEPSKRVAYDQSPPFGGAHDGVWAACTGTVYSKPVRVENMVHSLEHGAVWIAYNPDDISGAVAAKLEKLVEGRQYTAMSPYPGMDRPIALQSWGRQLKLDRPDDERIDQFIRSLSQNQYTTPETGASCDANPAQFDIENPPPFDPAPPGPDAVPVNGSPESSGQPAPETGDGN